MAGLSDYTAKNLLSYISGQIPVPTTPSVWLALFTAAPTSDAGSGGTEVGGSGYARVQVAGALAAGSSFTTSSGTITLGSSAPSWLTSLGGNGQGCNIYDVTKGAQIGSIGSSGVSGTTVNLATNSLANSTGSTDSLLFSAFSLPSASSGSEPGTTPANIANGASINFPTATASWGTVVAFGLYDAVSSGNLLAWDYLGNFKWSPFSCTLASPGVFTVTDQTFTNGNGVVVTSKYGGTLPTTGGSFAGILTVAGVSGNTFNVGVNTTSIGDGQVRQVLQQPIAINVTASFAASALTIFSA